MLATAQWYPSLAFPPVTWAQSSPKHAEGSVKAVTFIPSQCLSRGSRRSGTWQQPEPWVGSDPDKKIQTREEP